MSHKAFICYHQSESCHILQNTVFRFFATNIENLFRLLIRAGKKLYFVSFRTDSGRDDQHRRLDLPSLSSNYQNKLSSDWYELIYNENCRTIAKLASLLRKGHKRLPSHRLLQNLIFFPLNSFKFFLHSQVNTRLELINFSLFIPFCRIYFRYRAAMLLTSQFLSFTCGHSLIWYELLPERNDDLDQYWHSYTDNSLCQWTWRPIVLYGKQTLL